MLCVVYDLLLCTEKRIETNQPEDRQKVILQVLRENWPSKTLVLIPNESEEIKNLSVIHDQDYLNFLSTAFEMGSKAQHPTWFDGDLQAVVPLYFTDIKPKVVVESDVFKLSSYYTNDSGTPLYRTTNTQAKRAAANGQVAFQHFKTSENEKKTSYLYYLLNSHPGHHASTSRYAGYCFLNNAALLADLLAQHYGSDTKIGILDLDYHAGDGTYAIFSKQNRIVTCSLHCDPRFDYPHFSGYESQQGEEKGLGFHVNIPLLPKCEIKGYKTALQKGLHHLQQQNIACLVIAFGTDTYFADPDVDAKASFSLQVKDYIEIGKEIRQSFPTLPLFVTQEGGYAVEDEHFPNIVLGFLQGLIVS